MFWKNWPYWVKGGVIGFVFACLSYLLSFIYPSLEFLGSFIIFIPKQINFLFIYPLYCHVGFAMGCFGTSVIVTVVLGLAWATLIGTLIGWIYGKIKNRKK